MVKKKKNTDQSFRNTDVRGQQSFELHDQINSIKIRIDDGRVVNTIKKFTGAYYNFTPIGILFPASVTNDTEQIFVTCREVMQNLHL